MGAWHGDVYIARSVLNPWHPALMLCSTFGGVMRGRSGKNTTHPCTQIGVIAGRFVRFFVD